MIFIFIILIPVIVLVFRIILILNKPIWKATEGNLVNFEIIKKNQSPLSEYFEDAPNNYISIEYSYEVGNSKYKSKRISLDLLSRGYRPVEIEHDKFIKNLKNNKKCKVYYFRVWPRFSVLEIKNSHVASSLALLFIYLSVVIASYVYVVFVS